jgi:hypothetical protein
MKSIAPPTYNNILDLLNGSWNISRQIINYKESKLCATAKGTAIFYKQSNTTSLLQENVLINWENGSISSATKSYLFEQNDNSLLQHHFDSPINLLKNKQLDHAIISQKILMHTLFFHKNKHTLSSNSLYYCGMDKYKLSFIIASPDNFLMNYRVSGPFKNSYIHSIYSKES